MTNYLPSTVARTLVNAGRKADSARRAAEVAREMFASGALMTRDALASGVTASAISQSIKAELNGDTTLKAEVSASVKWIINVGLTGDVLALDGELPNGVGPRDVLSLVRKIVDTGKDGGVKAVRGALKDVTDQGKAVRALKDALKDAQDKGKDKDKDGADTGADGADGADTGADGAEGSGVTVTSADLTPAGKIKAATALVVDALATGTPDADTLAALVALADMIEDTRAEIESADVAA